MPGSATCSHPTAWQPRSPRSPTRKAAEPGGRANPQPRTASIVDRRGRHIAIQAEQAGIFYLLEVLIALNIVLGLLNMLPMLPLDGGHVAIAVYERIRTRRGQPYYQADVAKLLPVVYAFVAFLAWSWWPPCSSTSPTRRPTPSAEPGSGCRPAPPGRTRHGRMGGMELSAELLCPAPHDPPDPRGRRGRGRRGPGHRCSR